MMPAWKAVLHILSVAATTFENWKDERAKAKRQTDRDKLENDPNSWFDSHFNSVPIDPKKTEADKADATKNSGE